MAARSGRHGSGEVGDLRPQGTDWRWEAGIPGICQPWPFSQAVQSRPKSSATLVGLVLADAAQEPPPDLGPPCNRCCSCFRCARAILPKFTQQLQRGIVPQIFAMPAACAFSSRLVPGSACARRRSDALGTRNTCYVGVQLPCMPPYTSPSFGRLQRGLHCATVC